MPYKVSEIQDDLNDLIPEFNNQVINLSLERMQKALEKIGNPCCNIPAIQIAGTASQAQIPFFVTACDYTLIGEEFFAASAYLSEKPELVGGVKGQDMIKLVIIGLILVGVVLRLGFDMGIININIMELLAAK